MLYLIITLAVLASVYLGATRLVVPAIGRRAERLKVEARKAFDEETDRLEKLCEIGPYSPLSLWIAAEEEREKREKLDAERRRQSAENARLHREFIAMKQKERAEREERELEARTCTDGGEHMVKATKMECRFCGKPFNPFVPAGYDKDYRRHNPTVGERYAAEKHRVKRQLEMLERQHLKLKADFVEASSRLPTLEMVDDYLKMMESEDQRWRRIR